MSSSSSVGAHYRLLPSLQTAAAAAAAAAVAAAVRAAPVALARASCAGAVLIAGGGLLRVGERGGCGRHSRRAAVEVGLHDHPPRGVQRRRRRAVQGPRPRTLAGAAGELRAVLGRGDDVEPAHRARVLRREKPAEWQARVADRALRHLHPVDTDLVKVVLARRRHHRLHEQRLRAERAVRRAVDREGVACRGQLQPLQLLRGADLHLLLALAPVRQRLEKVPRRGAAAGGPRPLQAPQALAVRQKRPHELADHVAHLPLVVLPLLARLLLLVARDAGAPTAFLGEVGVQEPRQESSGAWNADVVVVVRLGVGRAPANGALRDAVLAGLVRDGPEDEALPTEPVAAIELHHVGERVQADGALLRWLRVGQTTRLMSAEVQLAIDEHLAQGLDGRMQLREVRAAEEGLPRQPAGALGRQVLEAEASELPSLLKDLDDRDGVPHGVLSEAVHVAKDAHQSPEGVGAPHQRGRGELLRVLLPLLGRELGLGAAPAEALQRLRKLGGAVEELALPGREAGVHGVDLLDE
mmetsp:Transcript_68280/g.191298  ORF Transcript_68280/g.191298 Transcript_68280/m.191298 type:complete len:525 (-) Transcript_68280:202-1776(-)